MSAKIKDELDRIKNEIKVLEEQKQLWLDQNFYFGCKPDADLLFNPRLDPLKSRKFDLETQYNTAVENERKAQSSTGPISDFDNTTKRAMPSGSIFQNVKKDAPPSDSVDSFCIQCGAKLKPIAKFCAKCGTSVS